MPLRIFYKMHFCLKTEVSTKPRNLLLQLLETGGRGLRGLGHKTVLQAHQGSLAPLHPVRTPAGTLEGLTLSPLRRGSRGPLGLVVQGCLPAVGSRGLSGQARSSPAVPTGCWLLGARCLSWGAQAPHGLVLSPSQGRLLRSVTPSSCRWGGITFRSWAGSHSPSVARGQRSQARGRVPACPEAALGSACLLCAGLPPRWCAALWVGPRSDVADPGFRRGDSSGARVPV